MIINKINNKELSKVTLGGCIIEMQHETVIISKENEIFITFNQFATCLINNNSYFRVMNMKNIAMWAIIVFLTIGLYNMFKNPQTNLRAGNKVIFSEFLTSVDNGEVLKVEIQGNNIKGTYSNGNNFSTYAPNDPNLIEKLSEKGVSISAAPY